MESWRLRAIRENPCDPRFRSCLELALKSLKNLPFSALFPRFLPIPTRFCPATAVAKRFRMADFRGEMAWCRFLSEFVRGKVFFAASLVNSGNSGDWVYSSPKRKRAGFGFRHSFDIRHSTFPNRLPFWQSSFSSAGGRLLRCVGTLAFFGHWGTSSPAAASRVPTTVYNASCCGCHAVHRRQGLGRIRWHHPAACHFWLCQHQYAKDSNYRANRAESWTGLFGRGSAVPPRVHIRSRAAHAMRGIYAPFAALAGVRREL
jgi:hypothetical protein